MAIRTQRIKTWWLCSWFPDKVQEQNGDFIERQAIATSAFADIDVFHIAPASPIILGKKETEETLIEKSPSLRYHIVLYRKRNDKIHNRLLSLLQYFSQYKRLAKQHIAAHGLPDIVHVHIAFKDGLVALWLKRKYGIPYIVTEHWTLYHKNNGADFRKKSFLFKFLVKKILKNATIILPVSKQLGDTLQSIVPNLQYKPIANVVNTDIFNYKNLVSENSFTFIHVSSLIDLKNPQVIIEAFEKVNAQLTFTKLVVIGELNNLKAKISNSNIELVDTISNDAVANYLQKANAFVLFSSAENQPCVLLESFCCGLPVISTAVGGVPEIITKENGILIEPGNVNQLAEKMKYLVKNYQQYDRKKISEDAIAQYNYKKIGADINDVYSDILNIK